MKDVVITEAFEGYPDGKTARMFQPSPDAISVPNDFADLIVETKGHARWPKGVKPAAARKTKRAAGKPKAVGAVPPPSAATPAETDRSPAPAPDERAPEGDDA